MENKPAEEAEDEYADYEEPEEVEVEKATTQKGSYAGIASSSFTDFFLNDKLVRALGDCGFEHPSEVQQECIPQALIGTDLICQAKAGMGKTAVFVLSVLQQLEAEEEKTEHVTSLVLAHTRELAYQIALEFRRFMKYLPGIHIEVIYGGVDIKEQKKAIDKNHPQIIVGTPGRTFDLIQRNYLDVSHVKHFIMDECDHLLLESGMRNHVQKIFFKLPREKQAMMFSATINKECRLLCKKFTHSAEEIFVDDERKLTLHGLKQHYVKLEEQGKTSKLTDLLDSIDFAQVVIFVASTRRAKQLAQVLKEMAFPALDIHSKMPQKERIRRYHAFKNNEYRLCVCTDVMGRGIDIQRVNLVINYDMPHDSDSYLHRVGRAGRFGTKGIAITFVSSDGDIKLLEEIQRRFEVEIKDLPDKLEMD